MKTILLILVAAGILVSGCSSIGLATPKSFDQQLAEAYGVHTAVASATATAVATGAITPAEAKQVQAQVVNSRAMLDAARAAEQAGSIKNAQSDLQLATSALAALQSYLNGRK